MEVMRSFIEVMRSFIEVCKANEAPTSLILYMTAVPLCLSCVCVMYLCL